MTSLIALADLKTDLGITGTDEDATLTRLAELASEAVEKHVGYPVERAQRTATIFLSDNVRSFILPFLPVHAITRVVVNEITLLDVDAGIEAPKGFGFTRWGAIRAPYGRDWCGEIEIDFESGYYLADDAGPPAVERDLPLVFEHAVSQAVNMMRAGIGRDPTIKSESVPGVFAVTYGESGVAAIQGVPTGAVAMLAAYRIAGLA